MENKKRVVLLGATGSIGNQTLDIIRNHPDELELVGIGAGSNLEALEEIAKEFDTIQALSIAKEKESNTALKLYSGKDGAVEMLEDLDYDLLINAAVGFAGVKPTLAALEKGIDVALANKESLVIAGELVKKAQKKTGAKLYPIDSEHSAIYQCLENGQKPERIYITASGGSLRDKSRDELENVSIKEVLTHPNWSMGKRITIDSATMLNKAFEVIEAHYLFDLDFSQIKTLLHPQSLIHSMVQFEDGALLAQLGPSDMHEPIQYALLQRRDHLPKRLDFSELVSLDLKAMDFHRYPLLNVAYLMKHRKGNLGAIINAADEEAIALFLKGEISFLEIEQSVFNAIRAIPWIENPTLEQLEQTDLKTREYIRNLWRK